MFVDRIYRYAAALEIKDAAVTMYFSKVTRYVLDLAAARGARIFYILDNEIRSDRFELAIELMFRAGVFVVTPYTTNGTFMEFADVRQALNRRVDRWPSRRVHRKGRFGELSAPRDRLRTIDRSGRCSSATKRRQTPKCSISSLSERPLPRRSQLQTRTLDR